jgi:hypothetical protein
MSSVDHHYYHKIRKPYISLAYVPEDTYTLASSRWHLKFYSSEGVENQLSEYIVFDTFTYVPDNVTVACFNTNFSYFNEFSQKPLINIVYTFC